MNEERNNLLMRREILRGYVTVLERAGELLQVCASVDSDAAAAGSAIAEAFGVSDTASDAILHLQVRRFTPTALEEIRNELDDLERLLRQTDSA
ncbi:hypothetical protein FVP74_11885 [Microbacterium saccharophilum]|uniref:DNA topoisomerase (ATP-hydrolyzing) n=1 Tax=Microbacterium saccharophilum TaxID=1213358 RepID=A0A5C8HU61_9MICO|nr:hypothetical protein [Microbacterium saccharophilum]TXK08791.1 hypothetical protein FVP74_11885 [Microbacterium saccharophilum]GEP49162.1 hypothetical protein MSA03_26700 [Microbacterium saccharophilum]